MPTMPVSAALASLLREAAPALAEHRALAHTAAEYSELDGTDDGPTASQWERLDDDRAAHLYTVADLLDRLAGAVLDALPDGTCLMDCPIGGSRPHPYEPGRCRPDTVRPALIPGSGPAAEEPEPEPEPEGPTCRECPDPVGDDGEHGMCPSCLHDAYRSGWNPGD